MIGTVFQWLGVAGAAVVVAGIGWVGGYERGLHDNLTAVARKKAAKARNIQNNVDTILNVVERPRPVSSRADLSRQLPNTRAR